ncbi:MAG: hypothetical protein EOO06_05505 [Chitinophagaceae bacterium]|nr:MAG: hypothetical protein EOO06_05505 [Chitinophagaceae bacterium]
MAKQKGVIKVQGTLDDITFTKTKNGYQAAMKSSMNKNRLLSDPAFVRTRENMSEFGRAGKAGKVLRKALRNLVQQCKDKALTSRMLKNMMVVVKADDTSTRGQRNVIDGETELLKSFEFNVNATLEGCLFAPYTGVIDRVTGVNTISIPSFVPRLNIVAPEGSTHYKIVSAATSIDFSAEVFETTESATAVLPLDDAPTVAINHTNNLPANSTHPLFLALGVQFFQQVNGIDYPLKNGAFNALSLVEVSGV